MPRLILNEMEAYNTDTAYRITPKDGVHAESLVYCFINSITALSAELEGRFYGGGVLELVPSEIERLLTVYVENEWDIQKLNNDVKTMSKKDLLVQQDNDYFRKSLNRLMTIAQFEKESIEYYNETYRYILSNKITISYPLLTDFVIENMETGMTIIESACHIKEQGLFVRFREYLSKIDGAMIKHDWDSLHSLVKELNCTTEEIYNSKPSGIVPIDAT